MRGERKASEQQEQVTWDFGSLVVNWNLIILNVLPPFIMIIPGSAEPHGRLTTVMVQKAGLSRRRKLKLYKKRNGDTVTICKMLS